MRKTIRIPHLGFAVFVCPKDKKVKSYAHVLYSEDGFSCKLCLPDNPSISSVAHELTHVLQAICARYNIDFKNEDEHMGYIMQYLMQEIIGKRSVTLKKH